MANGRTLSRWDHESFQRGVKVSRELIQLTHGCHQSVHGQLAKLDLCNQSRFSSLCGQVRPQTTLKHRPNGYGPPLALEPSAEGVSEPRLFVHPGGLIQIGSDS